MELHTVLFFVIACLSINLIPGPDVIFIVSNALKGKVSSGFRAALGLEIGYLFHTAAACLGLSAIILSSALAFAVVKWLGALYLLYLGVKSLISMGKGSSKLASVDRSVLQKNIMKQGLIVSVLNPKVALFFLSFLPQFIDTAKGEVNIQLLMLGLIFCLTATFCNVLYAVLGNWLLNGAKSGKYSRWLEGISGVLLVGLAGKIAFSQR